MKILLIADEEDAFLWDYYSKDKLEGIDLILSAGDLKPEYLSFLVTMSNRPLLYVHGNHDTVYAKREPEGCRCIDGKVAEVCGLRIAGLGGCRTYNGAEHQYTERQMKKRMFKLRRKLLRGGVDILLTHAPAEGYGDLPDAAHRGFGCFVDFMDRWKPAYLIHGHVHKSYGSSFQRIRQHGDTVIINAGKRYVLEISEEQLAELKARRQK